MKICLLNQFYAPDISPTAQLATSLIEHRARLGDDCTVICGSGGYAGATDERVLSDHVRVQRVWSPNMGRSRILSRASTYTAYALAAVWAMIRIPRQDVIIAMTTPPFVYLLALIHKIRRRDVRIILWSMDVYPEVAERVRAIDSDKLLARIVRPLIPVFRRINAWALPRLDSVVVLDGAMAELLEEAGAPPERVHVIPNWERAELYRGDDPEPWPGYTQLGLTDRFVVLYLGNVGLGHDVDTMLAAAPRLDQDGISFLFVGGGPRWEELRTKSAGMPNVVLHDYVDKHFTPGVLAGADTAVIALDASARGVMSPSKLHGSLGMGVPITYIGPDGSNVAEAIEAFGCGVIIPNGDATGLATAIRRWAADPARRDTAAANARRAFEVAYSDDAVLPLWDGLLDG